MTPDLLAKQIRSARAWLDWTRDDLAARASVAPNTLASLEKGDGTSEPNARTLAKIMGAFEGAGIEMLNDGGIKPRMNQVSYFSGQEGFKRFFDDVYETVKSHPHPDVCVINVDEALFQKWHGPYDAAHVERMSALKPQPIKALIRENDFNQRTSEYAEFRWISHRQFADTCVYIYGDKSAFIDFESDSVTVTLVDSVKVSAALRRMFDAAWETSKRIGA